MDGQVVGYLSAAAGLSTVIIAVINGILTRKRTGAETTEKITQAAGGLIDRLNTDNDRLNRRVTEQDARLQLLDEKLEVEVEERRIEQQRWERERIAWRHTLQVHAAWDAMLLQQLAEKGIQLEIPPTPPLTPPTRASDYPDSMRNDPRRLS